MTAGLAFALVLSGLVGVSLGLVGGGGSILAVPVLVYVAGLGAHEAIGASLAVVGAASLAASAEHFRAGHVDVRTASLFGLVGAAAAVLGARVTPLVSSRTLLLSFASMMLVSGAAMLRRRAQEPGRPATGFSPTVLATAAAVGFLTGFLGVGGGFLIVPALALLVGLPMHRAVGTSLLTIAINSAAGLVAHWHGLQAPLALTLGFAASASFGALAASRLSRRLPAETLRGAFGVLAILVGAFLVWRNG
jgi:uncharacterized membrane protein YfcA